MALCHPFSGVSHFFFLVVVLCCLPLRVHVGVHGGVLFVGAVFHSVKQGVQEWHTFSGDKAWVVPKHMNVGDGQFRDPVMSDLVTPTLESTSEGQEGHFFG